MLANVFICTLIMWGLSAAVVVPLTNMKFRNALARDPELSLVANSEPLSDEMKGRLKSLYNTIFIKADMLVMGIGGFIAGMAGFPLIGFAWKANASPGLLALIGASFLSYHLSGGNFR